MSATDPHGQHPHRGPATEPDVMAMGKVALVAFLSIATFAVGSIWALRIRSTTALAMNPAGKTVLPASYGAEEQGIVDQVPFELNRWVARDRAENAKVLHSYGWVDRKAGIIRVPIERAIELTVEESRK
jgi:hypothetical protein